MCDSAADDDKRIELLVEQWKLCVDMADNVSARRSEANKFYIAILTGILALTPFVIGQNTPIDIQKTVFLGIGFLGIVICFIWILNIQSYKQLNSLKFKVIHEIEQDLPFHCFEREWQILKEENDSRNYLRLSKIELFIPLLLMIPYLILLIYILTH